jgi:hypothetical protein
MSDQLSLFDRIVIDMPAEAEDTAEAMRNAIQLYRAERPPLDANHTTPGKNPVSQQAARRALGKSGTARERIYNVVKNSNDYIGLGNGLTADEIRIETGLPQNSVAARVCNLAAEGWLIDSGRRRLTSADAMAIIWVVAND